MRVAIVSEGVGGQASGASGGEGGIADFEISDNFRFERAYEDACVKSAEELISAPQGTVACISNLEFLRH
jgi:hypothetical protein